MKSGAVKIVLENFTFFKVWRWQSRTFVKTFQQRDASRWRPESSIGQCGTNVTRQKLVFKLFQDLYLYFSDIQIIITLNKRYTLV